MTNYQVHFEKTTSKGVKRGIRTVKARNESEAKLRVASVVAGSFGHWINRLAHDDGPHDKSWVEEDGLRYDKHGNLLRKNQDRVPMLNIGDRFFDVGNGRWAMLTAIRNQEDAHGAPFVALYDGCAAFGPFIGHAMYCDIGEIISKDSHSYKEQ